MSLFGAISSEEANDLSSFSFSHGHKLHLILPLIFFIMVIAVIFGREFYRDWRRKRRMRRYWAAKTQPPQQ